MNKITVGYSNGQITYTDEKGKKANTKVVHPNSRIEWELDKKCSACSNLTLNFEDGSLFVPPQTNPSPDAPLQLSNVINTSFKYDVTIDVDGNTIPDDPEIVFDDGTDVFGVDLRDAASALDQISASAWKGVFTELTKAASRKDGTDRVFFPKGISLISVEVDVTPPKVMIKVAGPDAPSGG